MPKKPVRTVKRNSGAKKPAAKKKVSAPAKKTSKPTSKKVAEDPKKKKKISKPLPSKVIERNKKNAKKPKSKKSVKDLEKQLGKKITTAPSAKKVTKPSRSEMLKKADKKSGSKLRKMPKLNIAPIEDMKQKLLTENENKEILATRNALKRRLQKVANFANITVPKVEDKVSKTIQKIFGFDARLNQIAFNRGTGIRKEKKQRLDVENFDGDEVQSSHVEVTAAPRKKAENSTPNTVKDQGFVANEVKRLNMRAGSRTIFANKNEAFKHMFGGKEPAIVSFSNVGSFQATTYIDDKGKTRHSFYGFQVSVDFEQQVEDNWNDMVNAVASATGLRYLPSVGPKHIFSNLMLRQFANKEQEFNFFVKNSNTKYAFLGKVENDVVYGMYVAFVGSATAGRGLPGIIFGYWCGVGVTVNELKTLSMGRFDEHFNGASPDPKVTQFLGHSMMTQFFNTSNRIPQPSVADISLTRPVGSDKALPDYIGKSESGAILYVPNVDLRDKFDDWVNDMTLPDELSREDLVPGTQLTEREYFAGRVAYTDMKNKIMFYYSKAGDLHKFDFSSASELNIRDRSELTKSKSSDPSHIKKNRDTYSFYGTSFLFLEGDYTIISDYTQSQKAFDKLSDLKFSGYREDPSKQQEDSFKYRSDRAVYVTIEGLRESYNGDKLLYGMLERYYDELSLNASYYYSQGHRDVIAQEDSDKEKDQDTGRFSMRDLTRAPQIGMMLSIARKSFEEWPHENDLRTKAKEQLTKMTSPSREDLDAVIGTFDGLVKDKTGNYPRLMPHQVETLAIMRNTNTAALDVDMGGGKTVMACLDMTRLIRDGITLESGERLACRPLVVMPGSTLVRNYISDVQKFFGKNMNIFTLETDQTVKREFSMNEIIERMQNAPANTIFVTTYSWIIGGGAYDMPLNTEVQKDGSVKVITKRVFPRVEMLKRVPITAVYLDESHKIKNKSSQQNRAAVALSDIPVKRILTGTMVSKDATDIFQQMRFLDSTLIGSEARFVAQYGAVDDEGKKAKRGDLRPGAEKEARAEIRANGVLQLRRSSWLPLLPEKEEKFLFVSMSEEHEAVYKAMLMKLVSTPQKALEQGLITQNQYETLIKLGSILGLNNADDDDDGGTLSGRAGSILGDEEEDTDEGGEKKQSGRAKQADAMNRVQQNMAVMIAMMQDFLTAPEILDPSKFDNDPTVVEAMREAGLLGPDGKMVGFSVGPKDEMIVNIIRKHFAGIGGSYIKRSEQNRRFGNDKSKCAGKVIIFHENVNAAIHFYNTLRKAGFKGVGMYQADSNLHRASESELNAFKDPEDTSVSIICAAEKALLLGHNMQSADVVIRVSTPWTVGDYDQSLARAFRNGQDLPVYCYNVQVDNSFEVLKLVKLFVRESSNKKLNSDFDVPFELSKKLAECSLENHRDYATQAALTNFPVNRYSVPGRPEAGMYEDHANLFVELHDEIWKQEKFAAYGKDEKKARMKDHAYLSDPTNMCEAARYYRLGLDQMSEMASGEDKVMPLAADITPVKSDGSLATHGELSENGLDALFNGFIHPDDRKDVRVLKKHEAGMLARQADPGTNLRALIEQAFDAIVETKPAYDKRYGARREEIIDELYADFTNLEAKNSKSFNIFGYAGLHQDFFLGVYNMVVANYKNLGCTVLKKNNDIKLNARTAKRNTELIAGHINAFRKANNLDIEDSVDDDEEATDDDNENADDNSDDEDTDEDTEEDEQEEEIVRDTLMLGLSKYFSDVSESISDDEAKLMLFAPLSSANTLSTKLAKVVLPSGLRFQKRVRYVYVKSEITNAIQIKGVLQRIEASGGNIEAKDDNGKYELLSSDILRVLMSSRAPSTKMSVNEHSIHNIVRDKNHIVKAKVSGKKNQNIDCGFLVLDGRITLVAFPDADKPNFNPKEVEILQKCGFKRIEYMVVTYNNNASHHKKLIRDLTYLATKFNGDGVVFHNEPKFQKHVKAFTKIAIDFADKRG